MGSGWLDYPRPKTGTHRRIPAWPESIVTVHAAKSVRARRHSGSRWRSTERGLRHVARHQRLCGRLLGTVVGQSPSRISRRAPVVDQSGQRPGNSQFPNAVHEASGRVLGPTPTNTGAGVLPAVSQQVQPDRTLLGYPGKPLERLVAEHCQYRLGMDKDDDMARRGSDRASTGSCLRNRRPTLAPCLPTHRRPSRTLQITSEMEPRNPPRTKVDYFLRAALTLPPFV